MAPTTVRPSDVQAAIEADGRPESPRERGPWRTSQAAILAGLLFCLEALVSPFVDSEVGYHSLNAPLNVALALACLGVWSSARRTIGRTGRIGVYVVSFGALVAAAGGAVTVALEAGLDARSPEALEGITHTAVLLAILGLVPFGLGGRRIVRGAGAVVAAGAAALIAMVLSGLDQPVHFLAPELALGSGLIWFGSRMRTVAGDA